MAFACPACNWHKGPNIAGIDPVGKTLEPLFNPRQQNWDDHFSWNGPFIVGHTPIGRATIAVLALNSEGRIAVRVALSLLGLFPPPEK